MKRGFSRKNRSKGKANMEDIHLSGGIGTHIDAPKHFVKNGLSIDQVPLAHCMASACVIHMSEKVGKDAEYVIMEEDIIEWEEEYGLIPEEAIVLIHTGWDQYWDKDNYCKKNKKGECPFPGISSKAAELFVDRKVKGVGIDTVGIDPGLKTKAKAHQTLLKENILVAEGLANLSLLPPKGAYAFFIPMKIKNAPEAPMRAIAFIES